MCRMRTCGRTVKEGLVLVDLQPSDVDDPRNALRLDEDVKCHLDCFHLTLALSGSDTFVLKVLDPNVLPLGLKDKSEIFWDLNGCKLQCLSRNTPWWRLLATHSVPVHQEAREHAGCQKTSLRKPKQTSRTFFRQGGPGQGEGILE